MTDNSLSSLSTDVFRGLGSLKSLLVSLIIIMTKYIYIGDDDVTDDDDDADDDDDDDNDGHGDITQHHLLMTSFLSNKTKNQ